MVTRWIVAALVGLLPLGLANAQPVSTDTAQLPILRNNFSALDTQYRSVSERCALLEREVLAYVGPVDAPMQPRDEACAALADASGRNLLNTEWRACSARHFETYAARRTEYRACLAEEARLGRARLDLFRQVVSLDQQLRQAALQGVPKPPPAPGWLGVEIQDLSPQQAAQLQLSGVQGAYVEGTRSRSPARKAGVLEGDMITGFEGVPIRSSSELLTYAQGLVAGQTIALDVIRAGTQRTIYVAIEARR